MADPRRGAGARIVLAFVLAGFVCGLVWAVLAPSSAQIGDDGQAAVAADLLFGVLGLVGGVITGLVGALRCRSYPMTAVIATVIGAAIAACGALALGTLAGAPPLRALPVLLAWPIGALIAVVGVELARPDEGRPSSVDESVS